MRELKFRGWDKERSRMTTYFYMTPTGIVKDANLGRHLEDMDVEVMQYTGLKDKNGVEIYEGDFLEGTEPGEFGLRLGTWTDVVVWDKEKAAFVCMDLASGGILGLDEVDSDKVIGNIYTHPEWLRLIKKEFDALRGK